jgi:predicted lipoprotein with Yx(FWY)xxD motif
MNRQMSKRIAYRLVILVVLAVAGVGTALAVGGPVIKASHNAKLGAIVVDTKGMTLYHLTSEHGKIACTGACTTYWSPVLWAGKGTPVLGAGLKASKLGTIKRPNGKLQVTYNKFPLYRYYLDKKAGQANGEGVDDSPGTWYAVSTAGTIVKAAPAAPGSTSTTTTGSGTTTGDTTTTGGYKY